MSLPKLQKTRRWFTLKMGAGICCCWRTSLCRTIAGWLLCAVMQWPQPSSRWKVTAVLTWGVLPFWQGRANESGTCYGWQREEVPLGISIVFFCYLEKKRHCLVGFCKLCEASANKCIPFVQVLYVTSILMISLFSKAWLSRDSVWISTSLTSICFCDWGSDYLFSPVGWRLQILQPLTDVEVSPGQKATFSCSLSEAVPINEVTWYFNDIEIQPDEDWEIQADGNKYKLILNKAQPHHSGEVTFASREAIASAKLSVLGKSICCPCLSL